jgi:hypothetical protein
MKYSFEHRLTSPHAAEDTWEALRTPVWNPLDRQIYPFLSLSYIYLDPESNLLQKHSRTIARPLKQLPSYITPELQTTLPGHISVKVEELSNQRRIDVFKSEMAKGRIERRVEPTDDNRSILVVEGDVAIEDLLEPHLTIMNNSNKTPAYYFGRQANQKIVELTPAILSSATLSNRERQRRVRAHDQLGRLVVGSSNY